VKQIRKRLTYANVMSSIAVFLILGGATAIAAQKIGSSQIKGNSITTGKIKKEAVTKAKIKKASVDASKLAAGAVTSEKIVNGAVTSEKIADGAVTGGKLAPGAVTRANLAEANLTPRGYALVDSDGKVEAGFTVGIPSATTPVSGTYCFDLAFAPVHAQATGEADGEGNDFPSVALAGTGQGLTNCPVGTDVEVEMWDTGLDEETEEEFFLVVW